MLAQYGRRGRCGELKVDLGNADLGDAYHPEGQQDDDQVQSITVDQRPIPNTGSDPASYLGDMFFDLCLLGQVSDQPARGL
jgi:hypothetical protein